ncbi:MAG: alpha-glucan family phosphorylase [Verrucomicrobiales bacterium]|nr:alpha-glucan family phosphorylase [Verrucomicrobiales bacterium]
MRRVSEARLLAKIVCYCVTLQLPFPPVARRAAELRRGRYRDRCMAGAVSKAEVDRLVKELRRVAWNLWWTWDYEAQELFRDLSPRCWQNLYHNAVAVLREVSDYELRVRLQDPELAARARRVVDSFDAYMRETATWASTNAPALLTRPVAYFCAEVGFHETLPIAAGGLGVLAGDHARSASDLGLGFVGVSLFYREGYFQQAIDANNWQTEYYNVLNPAALPVQPVLDATGEPIVCTVELGMGKARVHAWRVDVGRAQVYLLDADRPENEQLYRDLTLHVYGGDSTTRVMQELLLGVGGVRLLRALGIKPAVFHLNEGHTAFVALELLREKLVEGLSFDDAVRAVRAQCVFTTHTPVEAGHDRFSAELLEYAMHRYCAEWKLPFEKILELGRVEPQNRVEPFCMTVLALRLAGAANAVSELHGRVSRRMWHRLWPDKPVEHVPIGHITNGVHTVGWMKGAVAKFWRRKLLEWYSKLGTNVPGDASTQERVAQTEWKQLIHTPAFWERLADPEFVSDEELWAFRYHLRRELIEFARRRLLRQQHVHTPGDYIRFDALLNPDALTIGFARRFATYKRAPLVFHQLENIVKLAHDKKRPIQFIFAGKAHPRDHDGKRFIQYIIHLSKYSPLQGHLVFIENYDVHVARQMVSGCDVWLNTPRRPLEACGTSGMKAAISGCLNLSILDGWWREAYDGTNGFAIGQDTHVESVEEQDRIDAENLYRVLTEEVIPCFYDRDEHGIPRKWIQKMRRAFVTIVPRFSTWRMVQDYTRKYYLTK